MCLSMKANLYLIWQNNDKQFNMEKVIFFSFEKILQHSYRKFIMHYTLIPQRPFSDLAIQTYSPVAKISQVLRASNKFN